MPLKSPPALPTAEQLESSDTQIVSSAVSAGIVKVLFAPVGGNETIDNVLLFVPFAKDSLPGIEPNIPRVTPLAPCTVRLPVKLALEEIV